MNSVKGYTDSHKRASDLLKFDIKALHGEIYNCPVWVLISDTERDIEYFKKLNFHWYAETLKHHLNQFKEECNSYGRNTPIKTVLTTDSGEAADTPPLTERGGESKEGDCLG